MVQLTSLQTVTNPNDIDTDVVFKDHTSINLKWQ